MEAEKGVSGFTEAQATMTQLSETTAGVDEAKGKTLEQMSDMVSTLTGKIGERKTRLAPIIKELRPLRQQVNFQCTTYSYLAIHYKLKTGPRNAS